MLTPIDTEKLSLKNPDSWRVENSAEIAEALNLEDTPEFRTWLEEFIATTIQPTMVTSFLDVIAEKSARSAGLTPSKTPTVR